MRSISVLAVLGLAACSSDYQVGDKTDVADPAGTPTIEVDPNVIDFGSVDPGDTEVKSFTVTNVGTAALEVDKVRLDGGVVFFAILDDIDGTVLGEGNDIEVNVAFSPLDESFSADAISITSNDDDNEEVFVELVGSLEGGAELEITDIDFDDVVVDNTVTDVATLTNTGILDLIVTDLEVVGAVFDLESHDNLPFQLDAGESTQVVVSFTPDSENDFTGLLTAEHDGVGGSSSGDLEGTGVLVGKPTAVCNVSPNPVSPIIEAAHFDGFGSFDGNGYGLTAFTWSWVSTPGAPPSTPTTQPDFWLTPQLAGDYTARLVVTNGAGVDSDPADCTLTATPLESLWVEMFWQTAGDDMDLHLLAPGGTPFTATDCYWNNCKNGQPWGAPGIADDPYLDLDDIPGTGPENINILSPADGTYRAFVHDHTSRSYFGGNAVTVRIYGDGNLLYDQTKTISGEDTLTDFADITVNSSGVTVTPL